MNIDHLLVTHCAPTLAGLKMAALICVAHTESYTAMVATYNRLYNRQGLYFQTLGACKGRHLLYVYRRRDVQVALASDDVQQFLQRYGYDAGWNLDEHLDRLTMRFAQAEEFPHELGVFLGYPLADVKAFIEHKGAHAKCCGEWKVYTDVGYAQRQFVKYETCRQSYKTLFDSGYKMQHLIMA